MYKKYDAVECAMVSPAASETAALRRWGPGSRAPDHARTLRPGDWVKRRGMDGEFLVSSDPFEDGGRTYVYLKYRARGGKRNLANFAGCAPVDTLDRIK